MLQQQQQHQHQQEAAAVEAEVMVVELVEEVEEAEDRDELLCQEDRSFLLEHLQLRRPRRAEEEQEEDLPLAAGVSRQQLLQPGIRPRL
jgi:hypothetical protein